MIEKIDLLKTKPFWFESGNRPSGLELVNDKINELVDTVNNIVSVQEKLIDSRFVVETKHEAPADQYAEQRKCLCKLCWFWNDDKADKVFGILTGVFDEADRPFERSINQTLYEHCEPVKPDDDIIYKGGDNVSE